MLSTKISKILRNIAEAIKDVVGRFIEKTAGVDTDAVVACIPRERPDHRLYRDVAQIIAEYIVDIPYKLKDRFVDPPKYIMYEAIEHPWIFDFFKENPLAKCILKKHHGQSCYKAIARENPRIFEYFFDVDTARLKDERRAMTNIIYDL